MATSGNATGGNDVFNGKNRVFWWLVSQDAQAGSHGQSTIRWAWCVNWAPGDGCHTIQNGSVTGNSVSRYSNGGVVHAFSGAHSHSGDFPTVNSGTGGGFATGTYVIDHDSNGAANVVLSSSHSGTSGSTSTASLTHALTEIVQLPSAPTSVTATRVNDGQINVAWTNNSTTHHEYANTRIYRSTNGGFYAEIATLGVVTSYSDTTTSANSKYTYIVQALNAAGLANSTASSAVYTTPSAPGTPVASKLVSGNIKLDWTNNAGYGDTAYTTRIEHSENGGAFSELTSVTGGTATYEHVSPDPSKTHTYKIRARSTTGSLNSSYSSNSNVIVLLSTANAPSGLSPSGVARDAASNIVLTWTHNPTDGTPQSKRRVQYKVDAGSYSDAVNDSSGTSSYTITGGTLTNGHTITWKVATAGENGTLSSYSAESSFTTSARPTVTIADLDDYNSSSLTAAWGYFQAQSSLQATWRAYLLDASDVVLEGKTGTTETSVTFNTALADGTFYKVLAYVTSAAGLESLVDAETFTTDFLPPAASYISATYNADAGTMLLIVTADGPEEDVSGEVVSVDVQRQINGGEWLTIVAGLVLTDDDDGLTATVTDILPTINGTNTYRVIAYSATPTSSLSAEEVAVTTEDGWCFLNTGTSFSAYARFKALPQIQAKTSRARALYHFAGRTKPVQLTGEAQGLSLSISGMLIGSSSTPEEFEALAYVDGVVCWRDPTGRRIFASISDVNTSRTTHIYSTVSFGLTEVDYDE